MSIIPISGSRRGNNCYWQGNTSSDRWWYAIVDYTINSSGQLSIVFKEGTNPSWWLSESINDFYIKVSANDGSAPGEYKIGHNIPVSTKSPNPNPYTVLSHTYEYTLTPNVTYTLSVYNNQGVTTTGNWYIDSSGTQPRGRVGVYDITFTPQTDKSVPQLEDVQRLNITDSNGTNYVDNVIFITDNSGASDKYEGVNTDYIHDIYYTGDTISSVDGTDIVNYNIGTDLKGKYITFNANIQDSEAEIQRQISETGKYDYCTVVSTNSTYLQDRVWLNAKSNSDETYGVGYVHILFLEHIKRQQGNDILKLNAKSFINKILTVTNINYRTTTAQSRTLVVNNEYSNFILNNNTQIPLSQFFSLESNTNKFKIESEGTPVDYKFRFYNSNVQTKECIYNEGVYKMDYNVNLTLYCSPCLPEQLSYQFLDKDNNIVNTESLPDLIYLKQLNTMVGNVKYTNALDEGGYCRGFRYEFRVYPENTYTYKTNDEHVNLIIPPDSLSNKYEYCTFDVDISKIPDLTTSVLIDKNKETFYYKNKEILDLNTIIRYDVTYTNKEQTKSVILTYYYDDSNTWNKGYIRAYSKEDTYTLSNIYSVYSKNVYLNESNDGSVTDLGKIIEDYTVLPERKELTLVIIPFFYFNDDPSIIYSKIEEIVPKKFILLPFVDEDFLPKLMFPYFENNSEMMLPTTERFGYEFSDIALELWEEFNCKFGLTINNVNVTFESLAYFSSNSVTKHILFDAGKYVEDNKLYTENFSVTPYVTVMPNTEQERTVYGETVTESTTEASIWKKPIAQQGEFISYYDGEKFVKFLSKYRYFNNYQGTNILQGEYLTWDYWKAKCDSVNIYFVKQMQNWLKDSNVSNTLICWIENTSFDKNNKGQYIQADTTSSTIKSHNYTILTRISTNATNATYKYLNTKGYTHKFLSSFTHEQISNKQGL